MEAIDFVTLIICGMRLKQNGSGKICKKRIELESKKNHPRSSGSRLGKNTYKGRKTVL